jgi:hypothetical protein
VENAQQTLTLETVTTHTPESYQVEKDLENLRAGHLTMNGLEHQVITFLKERASVALDQFQMQRDSDGLLYSRDFPGISLPDLYGRKSGDPIYDLRSDYDREYIEQVQDWANESDNFSWIRFSPTTGAMSRETKIEIGKSFGTNLDVVSLTVPFREGQSREAAFLEIRKIAAQFNPEFAEAETELGLLGRPVLLENSPMANDLQQQGDIKRDLVLKLIDENLSRESGVPYYFGREASANVVELSANFDLIIDYLSNYGVMDKYFKAIARGDLKAAKGMFNNVVQHFDLLNKQRLAETQQLHKLHNFDQVMENMPAFVAAGCGGYGRRVADMTSMGVDLDERLDDGDYPEDFGDPHFGTCGGEGNRTQGCQATTIVGGCELCLGCHMKYSRMSI